MNPKSIILLLSLFTLFFTSCEKEQFIGLELQKEETKKPLASMGETTASPFGGLQLQSKFCSVVNPTKDGTVKLQKWYHCELDTLKFTIERFAPLVNPFKQVETIERGLISAKDFSDFDYQIEFVSEVEEAHVKVVWGSEGDIVPPFGNPMPSTLGAAALPTDSQINGYMYLNSAIALFDKINETVIHEFGHLIGKDHTCLLCIKIMNPYILHLPKAVQEDETEETNEAYEVADCI